MCIAHTSDNCKDELNYARDLNKDRLLIYLKKVELPIGMATRNLFNINAVPAKTGKKPPAEEEENE